MDWDDVHWLGKCSIIRIFQDSTGAPERKLAVVFGISKTEINRMLAISTIPSNIRAKAKENDVDKHVLVKLTQNISDESATKIIDGIMNGKIRDYSQVKGLK
jgi:hypothetical protein